MLPLRRTVRWGIVGALTLLLALLPPPASSQTVPSLTGTVVEAGTERPLFGADVILRGITNPTVFQRTATGPDGTFRLTALPKGTYVLQVQLLGYKGHARTLTLELNESRNLTIGLSPEETSFDAIVLSPSRRPEPILDVPVSVSIVPPEIIRQEGASSAVEALRPTVGVNVMQTGVDRRILSLRGFGAPFFGTPHVLVDGRPAEMPLLGTNAFGPMPIMPHDLSRIEVVRGPVTPLYGPEAGGGVVQFFTRDPFREPGTSLSVSGGTRSFVDAQFRKAGAIDGTVGYKFTGQLSRANEWQLDPTNPNDAAEIARYYTYPSTEEIPPDRPTVNRQLRRDDFYRTFNTNGLLTYRFDAGPRLSLRGGFASLTSPLQTGIGTIQTESLSYAYSHLRLETTRFSASVGLNSNLPIGDAYLLRTGETVLDEGTRWTGQTQYEFRLGALDTRVLVGGDMNVTVPETDTPNLAQQHGDRGIGHYGAFLQSTTELAPPLSLTLTGRVDYNDVVEEAAVAPRAALTFDLAPRQTIRASYTRSVSFPGTDPLFAAGRFGVDPTVRTTGQTVEVGYKGGFLDRIRTHVDIYYETKANVLTPVRPGGTFAYDVVDRIEYGGLDAAVAVEATEETRAFANVSLVTDDRFGGPPPVALNAPSTTVKAGIDYGLPAGFSVGVTGLHVNRFPVRWGPYIGSVDAYTLLDLHFGYRVPPVPDLRIDVSAKSLFGTEHREFVGAPALGRMIIGRLTYEL